MSRAKDKGKTVRLTLDGEMTIYHAQSIKEQMLAGLAQAKELELDLSLVGEIDTAGVQLLILAKREAGRAGKTLRLVGHSPAACEGLDFFNMAAYFGDPVLIPAGGNA